MPSCTRAARTFAATGLGLATLLAPAVTSHAAPQRATAGTLPHTWVHHADVDGDGTRDRVVLVRGDDLQVNHQWGSGHFTIRIHLATGVIVHRRMHLSYYDGAGGSDWSPWFGAAQIDRVKGRDLVVGSTSGAHTEVFNVVALHDGALVKVVSPGGGPEDGWTINSSYGTGSWGYRCTDDGVMTRLVYPNGEHTRFHIDRARYVLHSTWQRSKHVHYAVDADADGNPPAYTDDYATFDCTGLPTRW